jgi:hypothetical protein
MQDGVGRSDEAIVWLKNHFEGDPEPEISIRWEEGPVSHEAYDRLLDIIFGGLVE